MLLITWAGSSALGGPLVVGLFWKKILFETLEVVPRKGCLIVALSVVEVDAGVGFGGGRSCLK